MFHKAKSAIQIAALTLTFFLPFATAIMVENFSTSITERGKRTPLIFGPKGDRFDLTINSLFFRGDSSSQLSMADLQLLSEENRGIMVPVRLGFSARNFPIVGTSVDYFAARNITAKLGTIPLMLGEATLGSESAKSLNAKIGDHILTDQVNLYDLSASYPIKLKVVGVLNQTHSADDNAVFTSMGTAWVISGLGHGHEPIDAETDNAKLLSKTKKRITANASIEQFIEINESNINEFHFHSDPALLPITSIIAFPKSTKDGTILKAKYLRHQRIQPLEPSTVIGELLDVVIRLKRLFDSSYAITTLAAVLFLTAVILLSLQTRKRETKALFLMGCSRGTICMIFSAEIIILCLFSILFALLGACTITFLGSDILQILR
ncbi:MAG: hypothetical protein P8I97_08305 [Verrucomicrobiales bacterium]|nr:hypothetical protein [Verrucomicrobiales bacterium]